LLKPQTAQDIHCSLDGSFCGRKQSGDEGRGALITIVVTSALCADVEPQARRYSRSDPGRISLFLALLCLGQDFRDAND